MDDALPGGGWAAANRTVSGAGATLVDLLGRRAGEQPDGVVYTHLVDGEADEIHLTFGGLWGRARAVARMLRAAGLAGERALLIYPPGLDYAPALFGCFLAGVVAVPEGPPDPRRPERSLPRLRAVSANARAAAVLTVEGLLGVRGAAPDDLRGIPWIATDGIDAIDGIDGSGGGEVDALPPPAPDALAYLQYTSGSTADPKGVMLTHRHLAANCRGIADRCAPAPGDTLVAWVPTFHDLGLVYAVSLPVYAGIRAVSFAAVDFARRPARWPQALSRYRATHTVGPDTAYAITAHKTRPEERVGLDLSSLRMALSGAEVIHRGTEEHFVDVFAPCGFRPTAFCHAFGLSEATAQVSGERGDDRMAFLCVDADALAAGRVVLADGSAGRTRHIASCGPPNLGGEVVVVDPDTRARLPARALGELWVRSPSVGLGYFEAADATAETFGARTADGAGPWLRTGDRGFLDGGRVFVAGRIKELIIVRGQNHYPQDLEASVTGTHPAIRPGGVVAFSVDADSGEQVVVVAEVRADRVGEPRDVFAAVRAAIAEHGLSAAHVALVAPGTIPRTTSGKLQRRACRALWLDDRLAPLHTTRDAAPAAVSAAPERRALLAAVIAAAAAINRGAPLDPDRPLGEAGFDSAMLAEYARRVEDLVGRPLPTAAVFDHPSPRALADWLVDGDAAADVGPARPAADDPIVICGMACRLPGGVDDPEALWRLLDEGVDAMGDFPRDRGWDLNALFDPDPAAVGRTYATRGGFIDAPGDFDPGFFDISPREARLIDPQQRLLLELAWEALERADVAPDALAGERAGVFVGLWGDGYDRLAPPATQATDGYALLGSAPSVAAGRIAYALGLEGPAITVDTACSASLVALHQAAKALRDGECDLVLAGGATVFPTPDPFIWFSRLRALSPDGRSKAFAAAADGAGWSEGAGLVVLTRLSEARRRDLPVLAVVRGSAVNQDGRSQGLTAPNGPSQQRVIRAALASAGLGVDDVDAVEAHGTGTALGDPIEAGALIATYGQRERPLWLGAVKSNLGHTQAAAGVVGLMKMVLALRHGRLPATLHVDAPSPHVDWSSGAVELLTAARPWPRGERPRRAGVSSFGVSGTNAHVIIEEAPTVEVPSADAMPATLPLLVSGHTADALRAQATRWCGVEADFDAMRRAAALGRSQHKHRAAVYGTHALGALAAGEAHADVITGVAEAIDGVVFAFPGQGSQWRGMGRALLDESPVFAEVIDACEAALAGEVEWSLRAVLRGDAPLDRVDVIQPALFAMAVGLAAVWRAHGVEPSAVVGHSQGEIAAAVVAGALSLGDGARVVARRSRLLRALAGTGGMAVIELPVAEVERRVDGTGLSVAVVNTASSTVVAGAADAIGAFVAQADADGIFCRRVDVDYASHSAQVDAILPALADALDGITPRPATVTMISTVTGAPIDGEALDAAYWCRNLREPVRLDRALAALDGTPALIELSPHPVLAMPLGEVAGTRALGTLRRDDGGLGRVHRGLGALHAIGHAIDWQRLMGAGPRAALPTYAFQRRRYWLDAAPRADLGAAGLSAPGHALLGASIELPDGEGVLLTGRVALARHGWLADHRVFDEAVLPGTALLDLALAAAAAVGCDAVDALTFAAPLVVPEAGAVDVQLRVGAADEGGRRSLSLHGRVGEEWTAHATGTLSMRGAAPTETLTAWPPGGELEEIGSVYPGLDGIEYGPSFQGLRRVWRGGEATFAEVCLPDGIEPGGHAMHPALLDAALHALIGEGGEARLPFEWSGVRWRASDTRALRVRLVERDVAVEVLACDALGGPVLSGRMAVRAASRAGARDLYAIEWVPVTLGEAPSSEGWLFIGCDGSFDLGSVAPSRVVVDVTSASDPAGALQTLQGLLAEPRLEGTPIVWLTRGAVATGPGEDVIDAGRAPLWGLVRAARAERPDRVLRIVDADTDDAPLAAIAHDAEPELALRYGQARAPRLVRAGADRRDLSPPDGAWGLDPGACTGLDGIHAVAVDAAPLEPGTVRVDVRAAGVNFREVLSAMGMVDAAWRDGEFAGVVSAVGPDVDGLAPGDRVMGFARAAFATTVVADAALVVPIPAGLGFADAATLPVTSTTALYGLVELGRLAAGERVLIHAAAGGVGIAAVQIARHRGAEVYATASPGKWGTLRAMGVEHIAHSCTLDFERVFFDATGGEGVDVVLGALADEAVDASLRVLRPGGRYIEMGKTDIREPAAVRARYPDVEYAAFDTRDAGLDGMGAMLRQVAAWVEAGVLTPLPVTAFDLRDARHAFDHMYRARHVGKIVLTPPRRLRGPALITGGLGELGRAVARHFVERHGVRHLVLTSRRGPDAPGAGALVEELAALGAEAEVIACDVGDRVQVEALIAQHPPSAVFHLAAVLDDGVIDALTPARMAAVMRPKLDGAWHLHHATAGLDLSAFVLFSSAAGAIGGPGQGNYAAANAGLDALAAHRRARGLPAQSLAWGLWTPQGEGMTAHLGAAELDRLARQGFRAMELDHGLALLDAALDRPEALLVPVRVDAQRLARRAPLPPLWSALVRPARSRPTPLVSPGSGLGGPIDRAAALRAIRAAAAEVLGLPDADAVPIDAPLTDLGLDSLMGVELRNHLAACLGVQLTSSAVLQTPVPTALVEIVLAAVEDEDPSSAPAEPAVERPAALLDASMPVVAPLAPNQARLAFLDRVLDRRETYNVRVALRVDATLDPARMQRAVERVTARYDQLRMHLVDGADGPMQRVVPWVEIPVDEVDLRAEPDADAALDALASSRVAVPFDLGRAPLLRLTVAQLAGGSSGLVVVCHHIAFDGWSLSCLLDTLAADYAAVAASAPPPPVVRAPSYVALMAARRLTDAERAGRRDRWRVRLADAEPLDLPLDHPRGGRGRGAVVAFGLDADLADAIGGLARATRTSPFAVLVTGWATVLARYTGQETPCLGVITSGRLEAAAREAVGFFVETLPVCLSVGGGRTAAEAIAESHRRVIEAIDDGLPLAEILSAGPLGARSAPGEADPLLRATIVLEEARWARTSFAGSPCRFVGASVSGDVDGTAKFELSLGLIREAGGYRASIEYRADLFEAATIERLVAGLRQALAAMVAEPARQVRGIDVVTPDARRLLAAWNDTARPRRGDVCVHTLFAEQAARTPDAIAVMCEGTALSYAALGARVARVAQRLRAEGVGPEGRVAICVERSVEMVIALLGVLAAGGAYVPLEPDHPAERLRVMVKDAGARWVLTRGRPPEPWAAGLVWVDVACGDDPRPSISPSPVSADNLAYVIFTSGSTGRPKGVGVTHRSVVDTLIGEAERLGVAPGVAVLGFASLVFDASVTQILTPLIRGGRLVIASADERRSAAALSALIRREAVTVVNVPPAALPLLDGPLPSVRVVLVGGELCLVEQARPHAAGRRFVNAYGPTEATVTVSYWEGDVAAERAAGLPLGRPSANHRLYVLSPDLGVCPIGGPGELHIAGAGVARGYLGRAGLTAERFIPDPFGPPGSRLYRSGDRCRWRADGELLFLGRLDGQVKVRGFRIELGEIEAALGRLPAVRQCVAVARGEAGATRLVAYVVGDAIPIGVLREHLAESLPDYMIPSAFVWLDAIPQTPSGKVDRAALPAPELEREALTSSFVAPRTPTEARLAAIWAEVLALETVGVEDDFFEVGGDSLLSLRIASRCEAAGMKVSPGDVMDAGTIAALAARVDGGPRPRRRGAVVIHRDGGAERPLVLLPPIGGVAFTFPLLTRVLRPTLPVLALEDPRLDDPSVSLPSIAALGDAFARSLLDARPDGGPWRLAGYSLGTVFAIEVAGQLIARGEAVEHVVLLDGGVGPGGLTLDLCDYVVFMVREFLDHRPELDDYWFEADRLQEEGLPAAVEYMTRALYGYADPVGRAWVERLLSLVSLHGEQVATWTAPALDGVSVTLLHTAPKRPMPPDGGWSAHLGRPLDAIRQVPGTHGSIMREPFVRDLAAAIEDVLDGGER